MNDKVTYRYEYIDSGGSKIGYTDALVYYDHNTMVLFLNQYMTCAKRNEIVHNLSHIYK